MLAQFGWKAAVAVLVNASAAAFVLRKHLLAAPEASSDEPASQPVPLPVVLVHVLLLAGVVVFAHHPVVFLGLFLMFLGFTQAYERHQSPLVLKEALLVGFFLAGLVVLGGLQRWWLEPIVSSLTPLALFFSALGLTAITDNAALTYLGSLIPGMSDTSKYMLVAGAVAGGGRRWPDGDRQRTEPGRRRPAQARLCRRNHWRGRTAAGRAGANGCGSGGLPAALVWLDCYIFNSFQCTSSLRRRLILS